MSRMTWMVIGSVVMGVFMMGAGCETPDDEETSPAPDSTPQLAFDESMLTADCTGSTDDSTWLYGLETEKGWAIDAPYVLVYDNPDWYDGDASAVWNEEISLVKVNEGADGAYQEWERDDLSWVSSFSSYVEDTNTIFKCENVDFLTYVFCATDYYYGNEICVAIGKYPDVFGQ